jgi:DNA invertase Pin-like site-specific DNA recombinase
MAIFGYGRVSDTGQHSEHQRLALERADYEVTYWYADDGVGANVPASQRPQFQRVLKKVGKRDCLVVCTLDCLGRDARDIVTQIQALAVRGVEVIVLQLGKLDLTAAAGQAILATLAAVADLEHKVPMEPARAGSIGTKPEGRTRGRPVCTTQAQRALIIQRHRAGESISALARAVNLSRASIMRIVRATSLQ